MFRKLLSEFYQLITLFNDFSLKIKDSVGGSFSFFFQILRNI